MKNLSSMPPVGTVVIILILILFGISLIMLFSVCAKYRRSMHLAAEGSADNSFLRGTREDFAAAYEVFGQDVNTPGIITSSLHSRMGFALFCERFLNNAVSLFVTLGLFGTFLGLSLSVSSLTELISYSNTSEWLSVLDSVGGGLMSALSGMGVAFYTSLFGVACSIILTILRSIVSPETERTAMETELELWLDHRVAPTLHTERVKDEATLLRGLIGSINKATDGMKTALATSTAALQQEMDGFADTVERFNKGVRDFSEFDYNLRGTVERLDVAVRDFSGTLRRVSAAAERSENR